MGGAQISARDVAFLLMPTQSQGQAKMSSGKEKAKKASGSKKGRDVDSCDDSAELGESIDTLSEIEVKMRLEARDTFGKWYVVTTHVGTSAIPC